MSWKEEFNYKFSEDRIDEMDKFDHSYLFKDFKNFIQIQIREAYQSGQENGIKIGKQNIEKLIADIPDDLEIGTYWAEEGFSSHMTTDELKDNLRKKWL